MAASPPALRLLHVLAPAVYGGLERVVLALATGQRARGHDVHAAMLLERGMPEPPIVAALRTSGVMVRPLTAPPRGYLHQWRELKDFVRTLAPHIVHSHGYAADILVRHRAPTPPAIVTTVHGFTSGGLKTRLYEWLQIRSHRRFDAVIAVATPIKARLARRGVDVRRVHVVPNAFHSTAPLVDREEARRLLRVPAGVRCVGWIGRLSREKGPDVLIDALTALGHLNVWAAVIGSGPEGNAMRETARSRGLDKRITFTGFVEDAGRLVRAFDVMVLSSRTEGTPITLLEAMHARVPVVATAVGGVPDIVGPTEALLVPPDRPSELADAIRATLEDPAAAMERANHARQRLERDFALQPWLDSHERIYRAIMTPRP
jgi:glycosyltransferase involved in cell wall biosynthesis